MKETAVACLLVHFHIQAQSRDCRHSFLQWRITRCNHDKKSLEETYVEILPDNGDHKPSDVRTYVRCIKKHFFMCICEAF